MGLAENICVLNLSATGAMIEHADWLDAGQSCLLRLRLDRVEMRLRAYVAWTHIHRTLHGPDQQEDEVRYRSGLRFAELPDHTAAHIRQYLATLPMPKHHTADAHE